jgi:hypothetical protein
LQKAIIILELMPRTKSSLHKTTTKSMFQPATGARGVVSLLIHKLLLCFVILSVSMIRITGGAVLRWIRAVEEFICRLIAQPTARQFSIDPGTSATTLFNTQTSLIARGSRITTY